MRLILVGMANGIKEMWIAQQPFLLLYYVWQYMPTLAWYLTNRLGKKRVENFKAGIVGTFSLSTWGALLGTDRTSPSRGFVGGSLLSCLCRRGLADAG